MRRRNSKFSTERVKQPFANLVSQNLRFQKFTANQCVGFTIWAFLHEYTMGFKYTQEI